MMGYSEILLRRLTDEKDLRMVRNIHESSIRASELVRKMLAYSKQTKSVYEEINLASLIDAMLEQQLEFIPKSISIVRDFKPVTTFLGMRNEITEALINHIR